MSPRPRVRVALHAAAALLLALAGAGDAAARKFQLSGTWAMRNGQVFVPLQFASNAQAHYHTSLGYLSMAFGFPNGPVPGLGGATATGSDPATLVVPPGRFGGSFGAALPLGAVTLVQITTMFVPSGPASTAALAPGGGPGSFTWCPEDPDCIDPPGTMFSTDPPRGMWTPGRIIYRAGANRFGGVIRMGLSGGGVNSFVFATNPLQVGHAPFGGMHVRAVGGSYGETEMVYLARAFGTQPISLSAGGLIVAPGPKLTTMFGVTNTAAGPTLYLPVLLTTPMGLQAGQFTTHTGFPATTGTVIAQQFLGTGGRDFFTVMGSDLRSPLGAGNLSLVAGGISRRNSLAGASRYASFDRIQMTLGPPVPSLSPAAAGAAAVLVLLAAGYALRRRIG